LRIRSHKRFFYDRLASLHGFILINELAFGLPSLMLLNVFVMCQRSFVYNHTNCKSVSVHARTWIKIVSSVNAADVIVSPSVEVRSLGIQSHVNINRHSANMSEFL
jgi:hypothetical protein